MFELFKKYLEAKISLTDQDLDLIGSVAIIKKLRKHQYLLQEGDIWKYNAFVCSGCLRTYRVDDKGNEHILYFAIENYWTGDRESLLSGKPSGSNIDAIEDSSILLFTIENFEMLKTSIPVFNAFLSAVLEKSFVASQNRIHVAISQTAEEKYKHFIANSPILANRIPQHMIASYLGISPETLSRVRKLISKNSR